MRFIRFAIKLPVFLLADGLMWFSAAFVSHMGIHRGSQALEEHKRWVDWLRGVPKSKTRSRYYVR
jgi:hypothetical protein